MQKRAKHDTRILAHCEYKIRGEGGNKFFIYLKYVWQEGERGHNGSDEVDAENGDVKIRRKVI